MTTYKYGRLTESGRLERLHKIPNVFAPSQSTIEKYAAEHGYKIIEDTPQPNQYYTPSYEEQEDKIVQVWVAMDLTEAKNQALERVQQNLDWHLKQRTQVDCEAIGKAIIYDEAALINAMGLEVGDTFIAADDSLVELTAEQIAAVKASLKGYRAGLYQDATVKRIQIQSAHSVDELVENGLL